MTAMTSRQLIMHEAAPDGSVQVDAEALADLIEDAEGYTSSDLIRGVLRLFGLDS